VVRVVLILCGCLFVTGVERCRWLGTTTVDHRLLVVDELLRPLAMLVLVLVLVLVLAVLVVTVLAAVLAAVLVPSLAPVEVVAV
jgi:hypothetical protein